MIVGTNYPSRAEPFGPAPSQTRTSRFPASGSSVRGFAESLRLSARILLTPFPDYMSRRCFHSRSHCKNIPLPYSQAFPVRDFPAFNSTMRTLRLPLRRNADLVCLGRRFLLLDPGRASAPYLGGASVSASNHQTSRPPAMRQFRGSITRPDARCLRFMPPSRTTMQDSLAVGG